MNEKSKIDIKGSHAIWLILILTVGTIVIYILAVNVGEALWQEPYGISPILVAVAFLCCVVISGIYILGNGMHYLAGLLLEIRSELRKKQENDNLTEQNK